MLILLLSLWVTIHFGISRASCPTPHPLDGTTVICNNGLLSCDDELPKGTTVEFKCKPHFYRKLPENSSQRCNKRNNWKGTVTPCTADCGKANGNPVSTTRKIIGHETEKGQWPWHAAIHVFLENFSEIPICAATLIGKKTVITAAHCVISPFTDELYDPSSLAVLLGKHKATFLSTEPYSQQIDVEKIVVHESFDPRTLNNDIALLFLESEIQFTDKIGPVCSGHLHPNKAYDQLQDGNKGVIVGWGRTEGKTVSETLQMTTLPFVSNNKCQGLFPNLRLGATTFCAGYDKEDNNICLGDDGGGLIFKSTQSNEIKWYLQGIVSGSHKNDVPCIPKISIFTRVASYTSWISRKMADNGDEDIHGLPEESTESESQPQPYPSPDGKCHDNACCKNRQNPNPSTGAGYYQYSSRCLNGGLNCVDNTGCVLCWCSTPTGFNEGNRPICRKPC